jgi:tripartite-type tricarboxylate transporter receptor subunit TctC
LESLGFDVVASTPDELIHFIKAEMAKWSKMLREAGIKPQS